MNERLAVEAEIACLPAFLDKAFGIAEIVIDAVENVRPKARAAATQVISQGSIGARPGTSRARVSLARSLVPMTKPASRVSVSSEAPAIPPH